MPICIFYLLCACTFFFSPKCCSGATATPTDLKRGSKWFGRDHAKVKDSNYSRTGLHNLLHPCIWDARKWRENEKMKRKWRDNEEMERKRGNGERFTLYMSSFSLYFPPLCLFPSCHILSQSDKYDTFVANVTKNLTYGYEKIILSRIRCEEAPQVVLARSR